MKSFFRVFFSLLAGVGLSLLLVKALGESPLHFLQILFASAFGSRYDFGLTLFYTLPLVFTGMAVALPFRAGLFNIGAEGQLAVGALGAYLVAHFNGTSSFYIVMPLAFLVSFAMGSAWAVGPAYLKVKRGVHEVIATILFNFIAQSLLSYLILNVFRGTETQNPETEEIAAHLIWKNWAYFDGASIGMNLFFTLAVWAILTFVTVRTVFGFHLKASGMSARALDLSGGNAQTSRFLSLVIGGGLAGLVGMIEVFTHSGKLKLGFSPAFGFTGIAVALLSRGNFSVILFSAFLFGLLQKGATDLDLESQVITRDVSLVVQALIVLCVSVSQFDFFRKGRRWNHS